MDTVTHITASVRGTLVLPAANASNVRVSSAGSRPIIALDRLMHIKIFGERNSGTNLLSELVASNFRVVLLPGIATHDASEAEKDAFFATTHAETLGWKHARAPTPAELEHANVAAVRFLTISKNPFFWLLSMYRRPYHYRGPVPEDFSTFIRSPWRCRGRDRLPDAANPVALWNLKNRSYLELPRARTSNLRYEDYLDDPEAFVEHLATRLGAPLRHESPRILERSTKREDLALADFRQRYRAEELRRRIAPADLAFITEQLDPQVMAAFGYHSPQGA